MAAFYDETHHLLISDDDARGGVTGHNVRYVLAASMAGVIASFAAIAIYFAFETIQRNVSAALATPLSEVIRTLAPYGAIIVLGAIGGGLALGVWSMIAGRAADSDEGLMRLRVVTQFALICIVMATLYLSYF